ncbi:MAG: DMT family transporter [Burkholderiaceae bacterium]|nr:DMT family transporter [Burkholderiaceae bacterium]
MKTRRRHRIAQLLLWITPALWSSNYIIARASDGVIAPHALALGRWTLALALLLPLSAGALVAGFPTWRHEWKQMLVLGALGMWICGAFVYLGAHTTSATNIGLIYAATPVAIAFASTRLLHERLSGWQRAGMALALCGVVFVIAKGEWANLRAVRFTVGDLWILAAALSWVAYTVLLQRWPSALGPTPRLAAITLGGVLVLLPFTALETLLQPAPAFSTQALLLIVLAGLLPGFFSYQAYGYMLRELGAARSSLVMYLAPVYAAFTAWALLGEVPRWYHAVGAALILPAIYLATRKGTAH